MLSNMCAGGTADYATLCRGGQKQNIGSSYMTVNFVEQSVEINPSMIPGCKKYDAEGSTPQAIVEDKTSPPQKLLPDHKKMHYRCI